MKQVGKLQRSERKNQTITEIKTISEAPKRKIRLYYSTVKDVEYCKEQNRMEN